MGDFEVEMFLDYKIQREEKSGIRGVVQRFTDELGLTKDTTLREVVNQVKGSPGLVRMYVSYMSETFLF